MTTLLKKTLLIAWCSVSLLANPPDVIKYEASYLGLALLDMTLTWQDQDSTVSISYDNRLKPFIANFRNLHNVYTVNFKKESFEPLSWSKRIVEGNKVFSLSAKREGDHGMVHFSNGVTRAFPEGAFTVFSATHFLASKVSDPSFFPAKLAIFLDGEIWQAKATRYTIEDPHPDFKIQPAQVLIQTDLHYVSGSRVMKKNDILMDVIATEGTRFMLWIEANGHYSKAQFGRFPKAVVLERVP